jgi:hypothetical protein
VVKQLIEPALLVDRGQTYGDLIMLYINIALVDRANEKLKDFLAKVKPLTNALVSTYEELQKLQK